jgi:methionyl-tRNA formyltransferase
MASAPAIRIIVLGTGDFAFPLLEYLATTGHQILALVTQPDRPQGRKQEIIKSAIKLAAEARGIPVFQPEDINSQEGMQFIAQLGADLLVTAAYGQILSADTLSIAPMGGINLHGSILPAYRGAAPVARAIQNGETETGVTVIRMTPRIDAGGMIAVARTPIDPDETAGALEGRLAILGAPLVAASIAAVVSGTAQIIPQDKAKVTRAAKLSKEDGLIDWMLPALAVHNLVRAMNPWPLASTLWTSQDASKPPLRLIIHRTRPEDLETSATPGEVLEAGGDRLKIAAGKGTVRIIELQLAGKKAMAADVFLRGHRIRPGDRMSQ